MKDFGLVNGRQIKYFKTTDNFDWETQLPTKGWLVVPFGHSKDVKTISKIANICLDKKVNYVCAVGQVCELIHDIFDEEIVERKYINKNWDKTVYADGEPMTTWHIDTEEGISFSLNAAFADKVIIDQIVILDMTADGELETVEKILLKTF